jgi:type II secretory pathway pseudopilin PulG
MNMIKPLKIAGVTLLEILLVLAISASVILMSVRYYGTATASLQANSALEQIQALTATIDNYTAGMSYAGMTVPFIEVLMPRHSLQTPWGTQITIDTIKPSSYNVTLPQTPRAICSLIRSKLESNNHYKVTTPPCDSGVIATDFTYQYLANA